MIKKIKIDSVIPFTNENGWEDNELLTNLPYEDQIKCIQWVYRNLVPGLEIDKSHNSYGLKHGLEHDIKIYLTNNQFKDLMIRCGYKYLDANELNWHFNIDVRESRLFNRRVDDGDFPW